MYVRLLAPDSRFIQLTTYVHWLLLHHTCTATNFGTMIYEMQDTQYKSNQKILQIQPFYCIYNLHTSHIYDFRTIVNFS